MNPEEVQTWSERVDGPNATLDQQLDGCSKYEVPNLVSLYVGDSINIIGWHVFSTLFFGRGNVFEDIDDMFEQIRSDSLNEGFDVDYKSSASNQQIISGLQSPYLYKFYFLGHGDDGVLNVNDDTGVVARRYTAYGIAALYLYSCGALVASGARINYQNGDGTTGSLAAGDPTGSLWRQNVSRSGRVFGLSGDVTETNYGTLTSLSGLYHP